MIGRLCSTIAALGAAAASHAATLEAPVAGYLFRDGRIEAIRGIPGASAISEMAAPETALRSAALSSRAKLGIGVGADGTVYRLTLSADRVDASPMDLPPSPDEVAISPSGTAAALRYGDRLLVTRLLAGAVERAEHRAPEAGAPDALAVSDDGASAMAAWNGRLIRFSAGGASEVAGFANASAVAFRAGSHDAAAAGGGGLAWIRESGAVEWLAADEGELRGPLAIFATADGRVTTARRGGRLVRIASAGGEAESVDCNCDATALEPMESDRVLRLNLPGAGPLMLLEMGKAGARAVFVAPSIAAGEAQ